MNPIIDPGTSRMQIGRSAILGHLFQWKEKKQWNGFCENCRTIKLDSNLGFTQEQEEGKKAKKNGKKLEKVFQH